MSDFSDLSSCWMASNQDFTFPDPDKTGEEFVKRKRALRKHWENATACYANRASMIESQWFEKILQMHSEPQRHYHTLVHLEEMMAFLELLQDHVAELKVPSNYFALVLATFFHDAVYDPRSPTNEEDSAALLQEFSRDMGLCSDETLEARVISYILATKDHKTPRTDSCCSYLLDIDLAVLGKEFEAYKAYAGLIRKEYGFVDRSVYCEKRSLILQTFLEEPSIFCTALMKTALEVRARDNLRQEIESLQKGIIPGESVSTNE